MDLPQLAALVLHILAAASATALAARVPTHRPIAMLLLIGAAGEHARLLGEIDGRAGLALFLTGPTLGAPVAARLFRAPRFAEFSIGGVACALPLFVALTPEPRAWWWVATCLVPALSAALQLGLAASFYARRRAGGPAQRAALLLAACDATGLAGALFGGVPWQATAAWMLLLGLHIRELLALRRPFST